VNYSDNEEVVHVAGDQGGGLANALVGQTGAGEPLLATGNPATGSFDWVDQYAGANNDLVCTIPEPGAAGLLVFGLGFVLARRRSRA
jgi:hypothetical protein